VCRRRPPGHDLPHAHAASLVIAHEHARRGLAEADREALVRTNVGEHEPRRGDADQVRDLGATVDGEVPGAATHGDEADLRAAHHWLREIQQPVQPIGPLTGHPARSLTAPAISGTERAVLRSRYASLEAPSPKSRAADHPIQRVVVMLNVCALLVRGISARGKQCFDWI
jgi:hypothetical protein